MWPGQIGAQFKTIDPIALAVEVRTQPKTKNSNEEKKSMKIASKDLMRLEVAYPFYLFELAAQN